jgi:SAM-dependent methyltransferase
VRFAHEGLSANFILGDAGEVDRLLGPAMQGQFDLIWCWGVLHHIPSPEKVIQRLRLYIRPQEGELRFMVYSRVSYKLFETMHRAERWSMDPGVTRPLLAWNSEAQRGSPITHTYTMAQVRHELLPPSDQWEILDVRKRHIFIWQVEEYTRGRLVKDLAWQGVSDEYLSDLEAELGWHTCVVARFTPKSSSTNAEL